MAGEEKENRGNRPGKLTEFELRAPSGHTGWSLKGEQGPTSYSTGATKSEGYADA